MSESPPAETAEAAPHPTPGLGRALLIAGGSLLAWRLALLAAVFLGLHTSVQRPDNPEHYINFRAFGPRAAEPISPLYPPPDLPEYLLDGLCHWDAYWYHQIATSGYAERERTNFFPGYPYTVRWVSRLLGSNLWLTGLAISQLGLLVGLTALYLLVAERWGEPLALLSVQLSLAYPGSFFASCFYTEGLFMGLSVPAMLAYLRRRYVAAGVLGALATLTRPTGVALFAAWALDGAWRWLRGEEPWRWSALALLLVPIALASVGLIHRHQTGDPLAFFGANASEWGGKLTNPLTTLSDGAGSIDYRFPRVDPRLDSRGWAIRAMELLIASSLLIWPWLLVRRLPICLWAYSLVSGLLPLLAGHFESSLRHASISFPLFIGLAMATEARPGWRGAVLGGFAMLQSVLCLAFYNWYWVG